ncbi:MAG: glycerate-2-kinase family protein, partial [Gammaproteobacteria bacterium]
MSRASLLEIFAAGLAAVDGTVCTANAVSRAGHERHFDLVAIGKSACAMTRGLLQASGAGPGRGLIITRRGYADPALRRDSRLAIRETGHPLPDQDSLAAGSELLEFVAAMQTGIDVVCLVSGGASSLVEAPVPGVDLEALRRANRWLLASGLDIRAINAVRRRLSRIKGGGLAAALTGHAVIAYYISDVATDDPADIGSGLLKPSCIEPPSGLPAWLQALLGPGLGRDSAVESVQHVIVADLDRALSACAGAAAAAGYPVSRHQSALHG